MNLYKIFSLAFDDSFEISGRNFMHAASWALQDADPEEDERIVVVDVASNECHVFTSSNGVVLQLS